MWKKISRDEENPLKPVDRPDSPLAKMRLEALEGAKCIGPPFGCGGPVTGFRDELSLKEYSLSHMCQKCQDNFFKDPDEE